LLFLLSVESLSWSEQVEDVLTVLPYGAMRGRESVKGILGHCCFNNIVRG
jgi:hypothetical protein